jgi:membrane-bound serine protease (ClpP class)
MALGLWTAAMAWAMLAALAAPSPAGAQAIEPPPPFPSFDAAPAPPGPKALPEIPKGGRTVVVQVGGTIDLGLAPFLERVVGSLGAKDIVVLDINTFGGRVDAAVVIRDALLAAKARTVCWVHPRAISAGALISLACDVIVVGNGASIGAATPIQLGQDGSAKPVEEKMVSYMRSEMRATAEAKGRNGQIGEAMVDADVEIPGLDVKGKLLTLDGGQALAWGIASFQADDEAALWQGLGVTPRTIERPGISLSERIARVLSDPVISGLLMSLGMLGILIELYSGGHGVALIAGLTCLGLFFFGHHVARLAGWEDMALFVVGVGLLVFELTVPGHILPGVFGVLLIVAALVLSLVNLDHVPLGVAWRAGWIQSAAASVFGAFLVTMAMTWGLAKMLPRTRFGRPLVLDAALPRGASVPMVPGAAPAARPAARGQGSAVAIGTRGRALSDLRPMGKADFGGRRLEVALEAGHAEAGATVEVVHHDGARTVVRVIESSSAEPEA